MKNIVLMVSVMIVYLLIIIRQVFTQETSTIEEFIGYEYNVLVTHQSIAGNFIIAIIAGTLICIILNFRKKLILE